MAARSEVNLDVNDPFDSIVFLEDRYYQEGYNEGFSTGKIRGAAEGWDLGVEKGKTIGQEVGFYQGFVSMWIEMMEGRYEVKPRASKLLIQLRSLLKALKLDDPQDQQTFDQLDIIRSKFKQVTSLLGGSTADSNSQEMSF